MPFYPGAALATVPVASNLSPIALQKGESVYVFGALATGATQLPLNANNVAVEEVPQGSTSIAVELSSQQGDPAPAISVELFCDSSPGVFEVDIQEASTDADIFYIANSTVINSVSANQIARADLVPIGCKFARLFLKTWPNDADIWAKITRIA